MFIEPHNDDFDRKKVVVTTEHEEIVIKQITETWDKIQAHDFYKGCGKPECHWCNFVKDHKLYIAMHEVEEEQQEILQFI